MAEIRLTPAQKAAVENRGGALLISAAAGSGKTKVLVDRLFSMVCDRDDPADLDDFLIITYTKAAASELRGKIAAALSKRLAQEPENRHLQRQLTRIYLTQISTVHAFCASLLRSYAWTLELPPDFRVAEEADAERLQESVIEQLLEEGYSREAERRVFHAMTDALGYGRDDRRLSALILSVYDTVRCRVSPEDWMARCEQAYTSLPDAAEQTLWGAYLMERIKKTVSSYRGQMAELLPLLRRDAVLSEKYVPVFEENIAQLDALLVCERWDAMYAAKIDSFGRLPGIRSCGDEALRLQAQELRKNALAAVRDAQKPVCGDSAQVLAELSAASDGVTGLLGLLRRFDKRYAEEKRRKKLLDFSDLEHLTLRLLLRNGRPTAEAAEVAGQFREILVDEYQDSNEVQEAIFQAVSRNGENLFFVGDVKQSIYRFRLAEPDIFRRKYEAFAFAEQAEPGAPRKILLSENFRSRPEILRAVNDVFSMAMQPDSTELSYGEAEALRPGLEFLPTENKKIELHCIDLDIVSGEDEAEAQKVEEEAAFAAERIEKLLRDQTLIQDGQTLRPVRPGDIVILLRSAGLAAPVYQRALLARGIACRTDRAGSILDTTEGACFLAMLAVIDNPRRDLPLSALLMSPVFAFAPDEVAALCAGAGKGCLYDRLCACEDPSEKLNAFLAWLRALRQRAQLLSLTELLEEADRTSGMTDTFSAMADGALRCENLSALRALAVAYETGGQRSLMRFYDALADKKERGESVQPPEGGRGTDAVSILTIHKSKGLEFPVVYLADLSRRMNLTDNAKNVLLDSELLIGTDIVNTENRSVRAGLSKLAIADRHLRQTVSEELRVLYVAMTRARELLILSYCGKRLESTLKKWNGLVSRPLSPEVSGAARCLGDWVLMQALLRNEAEPLFACIGGGNDWHEKQPEEWEIRLHSAAKLREQRKAPTHTVAAAERVPLPKQTVLEAASFAYAYPEAVRLPSKLTATQLKGRLHDFEAAEEATQPFAPAVPHFRVPDFLHDKPLSGAERGNATHLFMQFVRYEACTTAAGIEAELKRLTEERFLTLRQAEAVERERILRLFTSPFGARILQASEVHREFKFSLMTDASELLFGAAAEQVMLQGVVDCFWEEDDGLVIVDFKTDLIRGSLTEKCERYRPQLLAYTKALGRIYQRPVKAAYLYFFGADKAVRVD